MQTSFARWRPLPEVTPSGLLLFQTLLTALVATWSLGGRADGAIWWISSLCWSSILIFLLDPQRRRVFEQKSLDAIAVFYAWGMLGLILAIGALNPLMEVVRQGDTIALEPLPYISFLPAALVSERAAEYGFLLFGVMVQALMLWHYLRRRSHIRLLLAGLALNGLMLAIVGAGFELGGAEKILGFSDPVHPQFFSAFRYHNHWTAFALLAVGQCAALGVWRWLRGQAGGGRSRSRLEMPWFCALILISFTLPMSGSRAGILFFVLFWLMVLYRALRFGLKNRGGGARFLRIGGIVVLALAVAGYGLYMARDNLVDGILKTTSQIEQQDEAGPDPSRFSYAWEDTGKMIEARPLLGWGFGCHYYTFFIFAGDHYRYDDGTLRVTKEFAHNDWLQFLAELGIVGFGLLIVVPIAVYARLRDLGPMPPISFWLLGSGGLVLVLASFEFPLSNPAVLFSFFVQATLGLRYWASVVERPKEEPVEAAELPVVGASARS